jgi:hypothetical protein
MIVVDCNIKLPGNQTSFLLKGVEFLISEDLPYEVIVGLDTINKHQLLVYRRDDSTPHPGQMERNSPGTVVEISLTDSDYESDNESQLAVMTLPLKQVTSKPTAGGIEEKATVPDHPSPKDTG